MNIEHLINELIHFISNINNDAEVIKTLINNNTKVETELKTSIVNLLDSYNYISIQAEQGIRSLLTNNQNLKEEVDYLNSRLNNRKITNSHLQHLQTIAIYQSELFTITNTIKTETVNKFFSPNSSTTQNFYLINTTQNKEIVKSPINENEKSCIPIDFQHIYKNTNENEVKVPLRKKLKRSNSQREIINEPLQLNSNEELDVLSNLITQISSNMDLKLFFSDKYGEGSFNNFIYKLKMKYVTLEMIDTDLGLIIDYKSNIEKNIKSGLEKKKYYKN